MDATPHNGLAHERPTGRTVPFVLMLAAIVPVALLAWGWMMMNAALAMVILTSLTLTWVVTIPVHDQVRATMRRLRIHLFGAHAAHSMLTPTYPAHPAALRLPRPTPQRLQMDEATIDAHFARIIAAEKTLEG